MNLEPIVTALLSLVAVIVWLIRLEGRVKGIERQIDLAETAIKAVQDSHNALSIKVVEELGRIREALARIEGQLKGD